MKRFGICLAAVLLMLTCFVSCGERQDDDRIQVVCTTFAQYDWAREITRGAVNVELHLLVEGGRDIHSYEPSTADLIGMMEAELLLYGGGSSEAWVDELIEKNQMQNSLCLMDCLAHEGRVIHTAEHTHGKADEICGDADEHFWLSIRNAVILCEAICERLCAIDPDHAVLYRSNLAAYTAELSASDASFAALAAERTDLTVVMADRYPFRYLFEDYGIECHAAFPGCSSESDASFDTVISLASCVESLDLPGVGVIEGSDRRLAEVVLENTKSGGKIFVLDSMQTLKDADAASYLEIMRSNLEVLEEMLGA